MKPLFTEDLKKELRNRISADIQLDSIVPVAGGDINSAARLETSEAPYFIKWNDQNKYPLMFELEKKGLEMMRAIGFARVPEPVFTGSSGDDAYLVLEWVDTAPYQGDFWTEFGKMLAVMHGKSNSQFGLEHDNYIGSLVQVNDPMESWVEFFIVNRCDIQLEQAFEKGLISKSMVRKFHTLYHRLESLVPEEKPALVHGDLWGGNFLRSSKGPVLIDPAVYYGHREMDLAMMHLFGGFDPALFEAYHSTFPP